MTIQVSQKDVNGTVMTSASLPPAEAGLTWIAAMAEDDLWIGEMVGVTAGGRKILLINIGGTVRAYDDRCPHKGTTLSDGTIEDGAIVCPVHQWEFDAGTGAGINPAGSCLITHRVEIADGRIWVALAAG